MFSSKLNAFEIHQISVYVCLLATYTFQPLFLYTGASYMKFSGFAKHLSSVKAAISHYYLENAMMLMLKAGSGK